MCSTNRLAFSITISATCMWREAGSSKVEDTTSPRTDRCISVTSSGRSSISRTISSHSGLLAAIECATCCSITVFPVFGDETIRPRCPFPIGATRSIILAVRSSELPFPLSSRMRSSGWRGVKFSNRTLSLSLSSCSLLICSTLSSAK